MKVFIDTDNYYKVIYVCIRTLFIFEQEISTIMMDVFVTLLVKVAFEGFEITKKWKIKYQK